MVEGVEKGHKKRRGSWKGGREPSTKHRGRSGSRDRDTHRMQTEEARRLRTQRREQGGAGVAGRQGKALTPFPAHKASEANAEGALRDQRLKRHSWADRAHGREGHGQTGRERHG